MFAKTQSPSMSLGFPDVCKVPVPIIGFIPIPFPNIAMSATAIPTVTNVFIQAMPAHNLATQSPISNGDEAGAMGGVVSNIFIGAQRNLSGSMKTFMKGMPATRMLSPSIQNGINAPGVSLTPSQVKVLMLG